MGKLEILVEGVTRFVLNYCQRQNKQAVATDRQLFEQKLEQIAKLDSGAYKFTLEKKISEALLPSYKEREELLLYSVTAISQLKACTENKESLTEKELIQAELIIKDLLCNYVYLFTQDISVELNGKKITLPGVVKGSSYLSSGLCFSGSLINSDILMPLGLDKDSSPSMVKKVAEEIASQMSFKSLSKLQRMVGDLITEVSELNTKLSKSIREVESLQEEVSSLKKQTDQQQEKIEELQTWISRNKSNSRLLGFIQSPKNGPDNSPKMF